LTTETSAKPPPQGEAPRDRLRMLGVVRQWLGMNGDVSGTRTRRTFLYALGIAAAIVGTVNIINVMTVWHEQPRTGLLAPVIWEGSSWITLMLFFWIPWLGWRIAPPLVRPRWKLLLHIPVALAYSLAHVGGFVLLRKLAYLMAGARYEFGAFGPHFFYEFGKDVLGYALFVSGFALVDHLLRQQALIDAPALVRTFDIRDGAKLTRVRLEEILAIASAGNYVEFVMRDGRRLLMRSPLSALELELAARGFVRTHRSWLVNAEKVTALKPEGSGDYAVELQTLTVPLSRRFPDALVKLRGE
jgi:DNA-binding LytR/AlgR family response regulator